MGNMQIAAKHIHRGIILKLVHEAEHDGASVQLLKAALKQFGYKLELDDVMSLCRYLEGKGLVKINFEENAALNVSRFIAHITPHGTDVLEGTAQASGIELIF